MANKNMAVADRFRLTSQLAVLKEIAADYQGKTIDNIIQQMEARLDGAIEEKSNRKCVRWNS